jgi:hypothetical protein
MERVGEHQRLLGVVGFNYHLRHSPKGVPPQDSKLHRTRRVLLN